MFFRRVPNLRGPMHLTLTQIHPDATVPERKTRGAFGFDLATTKQECIPPGEASIVGTGWKLAYQHPAGEIQCSGLPDGLLVLPRSSLFLKRGLLIPNSPGLIDADYTGEIGVILYNTRTHPVILEAKERIAQLVVVRFETPLVRVADSMEPAEERGGFGSTGMGA
jgi:dUTP pyrophosphatase